MAVLHDYACAAHGPLGELWEPKCPHGCSPAFVQIVFNRSAAIKHNSTKVADSAVRALAADFGLTNVGSNGGESVMDYIRRGKSFSDGYTPHDDRETSFAPKFMDIPHAAPGWSQTPNATAPVVNPQMMIGAKMAGENAVAPLTIPAPRPHVDPKLVYRPEKMPEAPE